MRIAVLKETFPGERRVALAPAGVKTLAGAGLELLVERGAGTLSYYADSAYEQQGARLVSRSEALEADLLLQVRALGMNPEAPREDLAKHREGQTIVGMCDPLGSPEAVREIAQTGASLFALELMPRITRAQSMDVLSSMATIAGYRAVLLAAVELPKMFPLMMTAAGTLKAARVLVIGAGVAGLQAIATAKRLGAVVSAYDVRSAVREQVESLGGRFVELDLETGGSEAAGGYAKQMDEDFYRRQREQLAKVAAESDVVISTAAIPGKKSPLLITAAAVEAMPAGGVIVDLAAERGGNCELSQPDQRVVEHDVVILGPTNLPTEIPTHASQMFSHNMVKFLLHLVKDGRLDLQRDDQIIRDTLVAGGGEVLHGRIRELLGLEELPEPHDEGEAPAAESETIRVDGLTEEEKSSTAATTEGEPGGEEATEQTAPPVAPPTRGDESDTHSDTDADEYRLSEESEEPEEPRRGENS